MTVPAGQRGATLAEFALISTVVLMMIFGVTELGRAMYDYHLVSNGARLGTRYAIVRGTSCSQTLATCTAATSSDIQTYVRSVSPGIDPNGLTVSASWSNGPACVGGSPFQSAGCLVTVTATYQFVSVVPLLGLPAIPLSSSSTMVISQ